MRSSHLRLGLVVASSVALAACTALLGTFEVDPNAQTDGGASSSSGTSGTSGTPPACGYTSQNATCNNCLISNCCVQGLKCANSAECNGLFECVQKCGIDDDACVTNCQNRYSEQATTDLSAFYTCLNNKCTTQCN